jgi:serine/threonine protein kinase
MSFRSLDHWGDLSLAQQAEIQSQIDAFVRAWQPEQRPPISKYLPSDPDTRTAALPALVQADLELRFEAGEPTEVEAYLSDFPEIAQNSDVVVELIAAEQALRKKRGDAVSLELYQSRFPAIRDKLAQRLGTHEDGIPEADETAQKTTVTQSSGKESVWPRTTPALPERFGRYRILRPIGRGGMGTVYLAEDTQLRRQVALKTPHFKGDDSAKTLARFSREARAAATLRHQNICPVYDFGQTDGKPYIAMAYIKGQPLATYVQPDKPHAERRILIVIRKLALALQEAHDQGIVHRDVKPSNVMVDERGEPIIMDFGIAQQIEDDDTTRLTQTGIIIGSPAYMSPEQLAAETQKIGPHSDQFSLGIMFYELLTGELPFRGPVTAVVSQILTKRPKPPSQFRPGLDPRIEAACLKMITKRRNERFASMRAVADELAALLRGPLDRSRSVTNNWSPTIETRAIVAEAKRWLDRHDYERAVQLLQRIPETVRDDAIHKLLDKARDLNDEVTFLLVEIDEAVELGDAPTALAKTVRLAELKPGHPRIREIRERFPHDAPPSEGLKTGWLMTIWVLAAIFVLGVVAVLFDKFLAGTYLIGIALFSALVALAYWLGAARVQWQRKTRW